MKSLVAAVFGVVFGFLLAWARLTDPDVVRRMLLLEEAYVFLLMASAILVGMVGTRLLRRRGFRALLTGQPVAWETLRPERRHVAGSVLFGLGWAVTAACPGPVGAQLGEGIWWGAATAAGILAGIAVYLRAERAGGQDRAGEPRTSPA